MKKGNINVSVENIFPLIKKFLYSDHEIFLRELISNATDATLKLKHIAGIGKEKIEVGEPKIEVKIDKKGKKLLLETEPVNIFVDEDSLGKNMKSVTFSLVFQNPSKTLEDKDVNPIIDEIIRVAENDFNAKLRS